MEEKSVSGNSSQTSGLLIDPSPIASGTRFFASSNLDLIVCLITLGFRVRKDPSVRVIKYPDGVIVTTVYFNMQSDCGKYSADKVAMAFKHEAKYCNENPECPIAYVIAATKNKSSIYRSLSEVTPSVCMRPTANSGPVITVVEGSEKYNNCLRKGMVHVNPDCIFKVK